uniref:Uncharacterized protein n=1 Tax=Nelumbo nucifera TaxID=4432 RepID=A0A822ZSV1_NELNU|nr:TPA_asm: hypothetical protein HUJ06_004226 [Nelumbo nucifera]
MASRSLMENSQVSSKLHEEKLMKEISELRELRTAIMVEKCLSKNEVITCPKPMRRQMWFASSTLLVCFDNLSLPY